MDNTPGLFAFAAVTACVPLGVVGYLLAGPVAAEGVGIALTLLLLVAAFMWVMDHLPHRTG